MSRKYNYHIGSAISAVVITELVLAGLFVLGYFVLMRTIPGMRLQRPELLWILVALPLMSFIFLALLAWRNKAMTKFTEASLLGYMVNEVSTLRAVVKFLLLRIGLFSLVIALVNPQSGSQIAEVKGKGIDIMIALDVSNSMLAEDIVPNRLDRSKRAIEQLVDRLGGDRLGIVVFAGQAYVQLPVTNDYGAAKLFLSTITPEVVPVQGTAIGAAIDLSLESFDFTNASNKAIIVITDGENHEDDALGAAGRAKEKAIRVFSIGMGSPEGAPIPVYSGRQRTGYKKDRDGKTVITKLDELMLRQIADAGDGVFIRATTAQVGLNLLLEELNKIEKTEVGTVAYADYKDQFYPFLLFAFVCFVLEFIIGEKRSKWASKFEIFNKPTT